MNTFHIYQWEIAGVDLYHILMWFFIYSFLGWVWESCYVSFKQRKWVNRGFVSGPCLTIYGFGALSIYLILKSWPKNAIVLFIGGMIVATILEYITAVIMEAMFHTSWWDYSDKKFNYQGRICLGSSLFWGLMTLLLFFVFQPFVSHISDNIDIKVGKILVSLSLLLYVVDFGFAFWAASSLDKKIQGFNILLEEWIGFIKDSSLGDTADEFKAKLYHLRHYISHKKTELILENREREIMQRWENMYACSSNEEEKNQFQKKYQEYRDKFLKIKKAQGRIAMRYLRAYPRLGSLSKKRKEKNQEEL